MAKPSVPGITIEQVQAKMILLNTSIQNQLRAFEAETGAEVHSVQVHHDKPIVRTQVKVQISE